MKTAACSASLISCLAYGEIQKVGACALKIVKGKQICSSHGLVEKKKGKRGAKKGRETANRYLRSCAQRVAPLCLEVLSAAVAGLTLYSFACITNADGVSNSCVYGDQAPPLAKHNVFGCSLMREVSNQRG